MAAGGGAGPTGRVQPWGAHSRAASAQTLRRGPAFPPPGEPSLHRPRRAQPQGAQEGRAFTRRRGRLLQEALPALPSPVERASRSPAPRTYIDGGQRPGHSGARVKGAHRLPRPARARPPASFLWGCEGGRVREAGRSHADLGGRGWDGAAWGAEGASTRPSPPRQREVPRRPAVGHRSTCRSPPALCPQVLLCAPQTGAARAAVLLPPHPLLCPPNPACGHRRTPGPLGRAAAMCVTGGLVPGPAWDSG